MRRVLFIVAVAALVWPTAASGALFERADAIGPTGGGIFRFPQAVAYDASGVQDPAPGSPPPPYVYVADQYSFLIQKFTTSGAFVRQWGGFGNGPGRFGREGTAGTIGGIGGVAVNARGQVFVLDSFNDRIQQFTPGGTFIRQWGTSGSAPGSLATGINGGLALRDPFLYVADQNNHRVQRFTLDADGAPTTDATGLVVPTAVWGSFGAGDGQFDHPQGVAVNPNADRSVYVADDRNHRVQKFDPDGGFLAKVGSQGAGEGQFAFPYDVAVDGPNHLYVADNNNHRVQAFDASTLAFQRTWGGFGRDPGELGFPRALSAVAGDPVGGVFVADTSNNRVQAFDAGGVLSGAWGASGRAVGAFTHPSGVAVDKSGRIFVADTFNSRIQRLSATGRAEAAWGSRNSLGYPTTGSGPGQFREPAAVAVDSASRRIYVADTENHRVQMLDADTGAWQATWGGTSAGAAPGAFRRPRGAAVDLQGNAYIADTGNDRVQRLDAATGAWSVLATGLADPEGVAVDAEGTVYVADTGNHRIVVIAPGGSVRTTIAGGAAGSEPGALNEPAGVAVDSSGRVLVNDRGNDRIQRFRPSNASYVFDGAYGESGPEPGRFAGLGALALDQAGNAFVADRFNNRIQRLQAEGTDEPPPDVPPVGGNPPPAEPSQPPGEAQPPAATRSAQPVSPPATGVTRTRGGRRLILQVRRLSAVRVRLRGAVLQAGRRQAGCSGRVRLSLRRGRRVVAARRVRLTSQCTFAAVLRARPRGRLRARAVLIAEPKLSVTVRVPSLTRGPRP